MAEIIEPTASDALPTISDDQFDELVDEATHAVVNLAETLGMAFTFTDMVEINDALTPILN